MKFEEAENQASVMIKALGPGWVMDLHDTHGWRCSVKNGPCSVTFNENSRDYQAFIQVGPSFNSYSTGPVTAMRLVADKLEAYINRITADGDAIARIVDGIHKEKR